MAKDRYKGAASCRKAHKTGPSAIKKWLVIPDPHNPFMEKDAFADMIEAEKDADVVMVGGDSMDSYSFSTFLKYESVPIEKELAETTAFYQALSERFPRVYTLTGNHDDRFKKRILERLDHDLVYMITQMTGGSLDPVQFIVQRFPNVDVVAHETEHGALVPWLWTSGDAVFSHAEKYSRVPGSALRSVEEYLTDFSGVLALDPFRVIFQFHTHALAMLPWRADRMLVECGCMCSTQGYQLSARLAGRPQRVGWVTFEQTDGLTDVNSIRLHWWR